MNIAILASGSGTNAENIIKYFSKNSQIKIRCVITNKNDALVLDRAKKFNIPSICFQKKDFDTPDLILKYLSDQAIDFIVLAGFLLKIPEAIISHYPTKIINIHPALLPKYGGKGMYGDNVHKAVIENKETQSGITIHYVNSEYDEGVIIFQATCSIEKSDTYETLASKIHELEYKYFPQIIKETIEKEDLTV